MKARTSKAIKHLESWKSGWLIHSARTALTATASLIVARQFSMPEAYWAAISTIVVMESTLGGAWSVSKRRLIGTALGAGFGGLTATYLEPGLIQYCAGLFALGLICAVLNVQQSAFRFAGIAFTIVAVVVHKQAAYVVAAHRFIEVSIGIAVALAVNWFWPGKEFA